ncbi:MAG: Fic family protein [Sphaerochaeta sp.]|jgi:Fic family protein|nr:Fic family protein [Spirochaetales bacterium]
MKPNKTQYIKVSEAARLWNISERSVRWYCAQGRVEGAWLDGKIWRIPKNTEKPLRKNESSTKPSQLLLRLRTEQKNQIRGGIYHLTQVTLTYNSNHIEGSRLTEEQTRHIFETNTIASTSSINVDDIIVAANHFRCIDTIIERAEHLLTEQFILQLHQTLFQRTSAERIPWFAIGSYKRLPNEVGGINTTAPEDVRDAMTSLLNDYHSQTTKELDDLLDFHYQFETIHPFQDGNGRIGRLILFKECLKHRIVPFIITEELQSFYYRGLSRWESEREYLRDTALTAQDQFKKRLEYFRIPF